MRIQKSGIASGHNGATGFGYDDGHGGMKSNRACGCAPGAGYGNGTGDGRGRCNEDDYDEGLVWQIPE